jgi:hypothetical protein
VEILVLLFQAQLKLLAATGEPGRGHFEGVRPLQHDLWTALRQVGRASEPYRTARAAAQAALKEGK